VEKNIDSLASWWLLHAPGNAWVHGSDMFDDSKPGSDCSAIRELEPAKAGCERSPSKYVMSGSTAGVCPAYSGSVSRR
jgi:hypothetical protein